MGNSTAAKFESSPFTISVERLSKLLDGHGCLAFVKLRFSTDAGSVSIDNFRLVQTKSGNRFLSPPAHRKGEKYYDDVELTGDLAKVALSVAVAEYERVKA